MTAFTPTDHATIRMAQRGMSLGDAELAALIGTEVDDGYLVLAKNCAKLESELKALLDRVRRLQGKRLVVATAGLSPPITLQSGKPADCCAMRSKVISTNARRIGDENGQLPTRHT
jgi:hypothetical protein